MNGSGHSQRDDGTDAEFPYRTEWTALVYPATGASQEAKEALDRLCRMYWFPLYAYVRRERIECHQAKDLIQSFFMHLFESNALKQANRERGRFRTFLRSCLRNFMKDQWRKEMSLKRGGNASVFSINDTEAEKKYLKLPSVDPAPESTYDRIWAATVIEQAMKNLKQAYSERGKLELFEALKGFLSGQLPSNAYAELSSKLGITKEALEVNLSRFRKAFGVMVRNVIAETVAPSQINDEIQYLMEAWSAYLREKP